MLQSGIAEEVRRSTISPTSQELEHVLYHAEKAYQHVSWQLLPDWDTYEGFLRALNHIDMTSSPGYPLMLEAPTNGDWLRIKGTIELDPYKVQRLWSMVQAHMEGDVDHIWRVFVKAEPHKLSKAQQGRWRLIISASLPMHVLWVMCFARMNALVILRQASIPSVQGYVWSQGGWKRFKHRLRVNQLRYGVDKKGWDWGAPGWVFDADLELRTRLCRNPDNKWMKLTRQLYDDAFRHAKLILPDGMIYKQEFAGFMKSGCFNTISTNSAAQYFLHALAEYRMGRVRPTPILACGDDTLQTEVSEGYVRELERGGCVVKEVEATLNFMGMNYNTNPEPMYVQKHLASFALQDPDLWEETLNGYMCLYACSKYKPFWRAVADGLGQHIKSDQYYSYWANVPVC